MGVLALKTDSIFATGVIGTTVSAEGTLFSGLFTSLDAGFTGSFLLATSFLTDESEEVAGTVVSGFFSSLMLAGTIAGKGSGIVGAAGIGSGAGGDSVDSGAAGGRLDFGR